MYERGKSSFEIHVLFAVEWVFVFNAAFITINEQQQCNVQSPLLKNTGLKEWWNELLFRDGLINLVVR